MAVRSVSDLGGLSEAEKQLLAGLDTGEDIVLGDGNVPAAGTRSRRVQAALIRLLLLGDDPDQKYRLHEKGLQIWGAWIPDRLDLEGCRELRDVGLIHCRFAEAPLLRSAGLRNLFLAGSRLPGLFGDGLEARGSVVMRGGEVTGELRLLGAKLGGNLDCSGARLLAEKNARDNPGYALSADGLEARGDVVLDDVEAIGEVRLVGAKVGGDLNCLRARFRAEKNARGNPGRALFADRLEARGGVFLGDVEATGVVRLLGAKLGGALDCSGAQFRAEKDARGDPGHALLADRLEARGGVLLGDVEAAGEVRLLGAKLGGNLSCIGARFRAESDARGNPGRALSADRLEARGGMVLRGVEATGEVWLVGAKLGGDLDCNGARFWVEKDARGDPGHALAADGLEVGGGVVLRGVEAIGEVRLLGAKLGGDLDCTGAQFRVEKDARGDLQRALIAQGARVLGTLFLHRGAAVEGVLDLTAAELGNITDDPRCWPVAGDLLLDRCRYGAFTGGPVDADTRLDWLARQDPARWGAEFWPQPYEQLAMVLREMGHGADARAVLVEKERLQRAARRTQWQARLDGARLRLRVEEEGLAAVKPAIAVSLERFKKRDPRRAYIDEELRKSPQFRKFPDGRVESDTGGSGGAANGVDRVSAARAAVWNYWWRLNPLRVSDCVVGATIGYGRKPERAALWAVGFLLLGLFVFAWAAGHDAIKPNTPLVLRAAEWVECAAEGTRHAAGETQLVCFLRQPEARGYPRFNAFVYSADTLLPIVSLEMQGFWIPDEGTSQGWWARGYLWAHIGVGWALSLLVVAGFSGLVKSD